MKRKFEIFEKGWESFLVSSSDDKIRVKNINGNTEGRTLNAHAEMPSRETEMYFAGFLSMQKRSKMAKKRSDHFQTFESDDFSVFIFIFPLFLFDFDVL